MQTFNQLFFKKKQIFSYFFKEISDYNFPRMLPLLRKIDDNMNMVGHNDIIK